MVRLRRSSVFADGAAVSFGRWSGHRPMAGAHLALSPLFRAAGRHSLPAASEVLRIGMMEVSTSSATPAGTTLLGIDPPLGQHARSQVRRAGREKWEEEIPPVCRVPYHTYYSPVDNIGDTWRPKE
jgi:hypothetical protein